MSTPSEGPLFTPGNYAESADYVRNLTPEQQENLRQFVDMTPQQRQVMQQFMDLSPEGADKLIRSANKKPLRARAEATIARGVARVKDVYHHNAERLSDAAQSLASQAREYRQAVVGGANLAAQGAAQAYRDVRDPVVDRYNQASEQVADLVDRGAVAVDNAVQWAGERANAAGRAVVDTTVEAGRRIGQGAEAVGRGAQAVADGAVAAGGAAVNGAVRGAQATGRGAAAAGEAVVGAGQQAVAAGQRLAGNVSRWAQDRWSNAQLRAEQGMAAVKAFQVDPTQPQGVFNTREKLELAAHFSKMLNARDPEAFAAASQALNEKVQSAAQAQNMSVALGGMAQAGSAAPAQTTGQDQGNQQGSQPQINLNKNTPAKDGGRGV